MENTYELLVTFCGEDELTSIIFKSETDLEALAIVVHQFIGDDIYKDGNKLVDEEGYKLSKEHLISRILHSEDIYYKLTNLTTNQILYINKHFIHQWNSDYEPIPQLEK